MNTTHPRRQDVKGRWFWVVPAPKQQQCTHCWRQENEVGMATCAKMIQSMPKDDRCGWRDVIYIMDTPEDVARYVSAMLGATP